MTSLLIVALSLIIGVVIGGIIENSVARHRK